MRKKVLDRLCLFKTNQAYIGVVHYTDKPEHSFVYNKQSMLNTFKGHLFNNNKNTFKLSLSV